MISSFNNYKKSRKGKNCLLEPPKENVQIIEKQLTTVFHTFNMHTTALLGRRTLQFQSVPDVNDIFLTFSFNLSLCEHYTVLVPSNPASSHL